MKDLSDKTMDSDLLHELARRAGIVVHWHDTQGRQHTVADEVLIRILTQLELPATSLEELRESRARIDAPPYATIPSFCTGLSGMPLRIPCRVRLSKLTFFLELEGARPVEGVATQADNGELEFPAIHAIGYHRLCIADSQIVVAIAPERCFGISDALSSDRQHRPWGLQVPMYALRRETPTGVGDFTALSKFCTWAGRHGAAAVGINPVHAGSFAFPERTSPYSPSSRLFLNPVYVDPASTFGAGAVAAVHDELGIGRELADSDRQALIDWPATMNARAIVLRRLFERRGDLLSAQLTNEYLTFRIRGGAALTEHACFEALHRALKSGQASNWTVWPTQYQSAHTLDVQRFAHEHAEDIEFYVFAQWLAARGLAGAQSDALAAGMSIGIIGDLAVGTDPWGSHAWSRQGQIIRGLVCGAPPDVYNPKGQSWGLAVFSPRALQQSGFSALIEMLRAILAECGGMRIDHVLGLMRLWLIPDGEKAQDGAYLLYPFEDMLRLVALESWRHRAIIIGENLGTVPSGFNEHLKARGILGTSVLWFERQDQAFAAPRHWPVISVGTTTTHDLPTVAGWWRGEDLRLRTSLGQLGDAQTLSDLLITRAQDRQALWNALEDEGCVTGDAPQNLEDPPLSSILEFVASTPCSLVLIPMEDLLGLTDQPNLPGTVDEHPNWRRRFHDSVDDQFNLPRTIERLARIAGARAK